MTRNATKEEAMRGKDDTLPVTPVGLKAAIDDRGFITQGVPIGACIWWPTGTVPDGWLVRDGSAISRTTYSGLFDLIGVIYGNGDGSTTFNLPDDRGRFIRARDGGAGRDADSASRTDRGDGTTGDNVGTLQSDAIRNISGQFRGLNNTVFVSWTGVFSNGGLTYNSSNRSSSLGSQLTNFSAADQVPTGSDNRPNNRYYLPIIKY